MRDLHKRVRIALHNDWDPIGVANFTAEMGEYDSYVSKLCELLERDASEEEIFEYLWTVETQSIGLAGNRHATEQFAQRLCNLKSRDG